MTENQGEKRQLPCCPICNHQLDPEELTWSDLSENPLCPGCLAEEESCGCADE